MAHGYVPFEIDKLCGALSLNDSNKSITRDQLTEISQALNFSADELDIIFGALDHTGKGHITVDDLKVDIAGDRKSTPNKKRNNIPVTSSSSPRMTWRSSPRMTWREKYASSEILSLEDLDWDVLSSERFVMKVHVKMRSLLLVINTVFSVRCY